jgi:hypothetical protein
MRPLADWQFNPSRPLQTKRGTAQALRCGLDKIDELIRMKRVKVVPFGASQRITTQSILELAEHGYVLDEID